MNPRHALTAFALAAGLAVGPLAVSVVHAQGAKPDARPEASSRLSIAQVVERLAAQGYRDIDGIEREGGTYEVDARTSAGDRVELRVDAYSGAILKTRTESRSRDRDARHTSGHGNRTPAECGGPPCRVDAQAQTLPGATIGWNLSDIYARLAPAGG